MTKEIRQVPTLSDVETEQLFGWGDNIFGVSSFNLRWKPKDLHFLLDVDGRPVSHVGIVKHVVTVGGEPVTVGGVAGVVTIPEAQRRGHARELVQHAMRFLEEWKVDAGLLFCLKRLVSYYEALGWKLVEYPVVIEQPAGEITSPLEVMVIPLDGRSWPDGTVKLNSFPW